MKSKVTRDKWGLILVVVLLCWEVRADDGAFVYDPLPEQNIVSATLSVDFAGLNAHRTVGESETNFFKLIDLKKTPSK